MWVDDTKLAVLSAVADQVSDIHQLCHEATALEYLRAKPRWEEHFGGPSGETRFWATVCQLVDDGLLRRATHKKTGAPLVGLEEAAVKVEGLDVSYLL
jgi:hypothetical protein